MQPDSRKLIWDGWQATERLAKFTAGKALDHYLGDELLRSAVERQFEILGEALAQLRQGDPETAALVPDLRAIVAFRNVLAHGYAIIDHSNVWDVVQNDLRGINQALSSLLGQS